MLRVNGEQSDRTISMTGILAPRISRGRNAPAPDEPFAWESREFLRRQTISKPIQFDIAFTSKTGKEYGTLLLEGKTNLAQAVVAAGFADAQEGPPRKDGSQFPDRAALLELKENAVAAGIGMWSKAPGTHVRQINWDAERNGTAFLQQTKGKTLAGVIDRIVDGSSYRVELTGEGLRHTMITVHVIGVQCPRIPLPNKESGETPDPEPFALAAREYVEARLLNQDVGIVLHAVDKLNNFFGSVLFPKGNIAVLLLKNGLGNLVPWTAALSPDQAALKEAEEKARKQGLNVWSGSTTAPARVAAAAHTESKDDSKHTGTVFMKSFTAKVSQVVSGDTLLVQDGDGNSKRVSLASVQAPRLGVRGSPDAPWSVDAKEFLRKRVVGKKVKVNVEYTRSLPPRVPGGEPEIRVFVACIHNKSNLAEALIEAGLATVVRHRVEEPRSLHYEALLAAEEKAKAAGRALHGKAPAPVHSHVDLCDKPRPEGPTEEAKRKAELAQRQLTAKAKQYLPFLSKEKALRGVVEYCFSGSRFKIFVEKQNCMIAFVLAGIRCPNPSAARGRTAEPFAQEALQFAWDLCMQQDVRIEVESLDKGDNFIGQMFVGAKSLALSLVEEGLAAVYTNPYQDAAMQAELIAAETLAKDQKKRMWKNWTAPVEAPVAAAEPRDEEVRPEQSLATVTVTEVIDAANFYVHIVGNEVNKQAIEDELQRIGAGPPPTQPFLPKRGVVCAGRFVDGKWYRVRVDTKLEDGTVSVLFIDFGNADSLEMTALRPITDDAVRQMSPLGRLCTLAGLKAPHGDHDSYNEAIDTLCSLLVPNSGKQLLAKVHLKEQNKLHVTMHDDNTPDSVNKQMVQAGMVRIQRRPHRRLLDIVDLLRDDEASAQDRRDGIWTFGVVSDPEEEEETSRR